MSLSGRIMQASKAYATEHGRKFSTVVEDALREHLEAHDALPNSDDAELQATLSGLAEAYTTDELRSILNQRTAIEACVNSERNT
ncbi:MAG: hypothetical protein JW942_06830 [Opitutales bacterium]|nr:hypothetical protein [Opitutales bacterium]